MNNRDDNALLQDQEAVEILKFLLEIGYTKEQVVNGLKKLAAKRQYYKAEALKGLLASGPHDCEVAELVHDAALYANAMLAEDEAHERERK